MAVSVFLDPVAYSHLTILHLFLERLPDVGSLNCHIALHIERQTISANELLQQLQQAETTILTFSNELAEIVLMGFKKGNDGFIINLIKFKLILFLLASSTAMR